MTFEAQPLNVSNLVISKLADYCEQNQRVIGVSTDTTLAQLDLDSLALMEIVYDLEEELGITLEPAALQSIGRVSDLVAAINRLRKSAA